MLFPVYHQKQSQQNYCHSNLASKKELLQTSFVMKIFVRKILFFFKLPPFFFSLFLLTDILDKHYTYQ